MTAGSLSARSGRRAARGGGSGEQRWQRADDAVEEARRAGYAVPTEQAEQLLSAVGGQCQANRQPNDQETEGHGCPEQGLRGRPDACGRSQKPHEGGKRFDVLAIVLQLGDDVARRDVRCVARRRLLAFYAEGPTDRPSDERYCSRTVDVTCSRAIAFGATAIGAPLSRRSRARRSSTLNGMS